MKNITRNKNACPETGRNSSTETTVFQPKREEKGSGCGKEFGSSSNNGFLNGKRGFPTKCVYGGDVKMYTSESQANPGHPYFRCAVSRQSGHLFKWVEDGMYEEVIDLLQRESENEKGIIEVNVLKVEMENAKEQILQCKTKLRKFKIKNMVLIVCFCVFGFGYHLSHHVSETCRKHNCIS